MRTPVSLRNIIGVAIKPLLESIIPLECHLNFHTFFALCLKVTHLCNRRFTLVQKLNKCSESALIGEQGFLTAALILQKNTDATI